MTTFVLMAGLPGTGKSTLANALAEQLHGVVLNKDTVRAALFPGPLTDYTRAQDDLCFEAVLRAAQYLAAYGRSEFVFLDGRTFSRREQIEQAIQAAEDAGCRWTIVHATCPDEIAEARLAADAGGHPATNRTIGMYRELRDGFQDIVRPHLRIDTSQKLQNCVEAARASLLSVDGVSSPVPWL